eukprot:TRINITY_DN30980_c0_g1_i2.p1 TRINITY_DN30980_c0_g1~~TRINITY_DN30980_c0_g1_i2.p1  ORF type:complete len:139 (+),score=38.14 TRINITY_DN30980_c0_g1_i2:158-574(+)
MCIRDRVSTQSTGNCCATAMASDSFMPHDIGEEWGDNEDATVDLCQIEYSVDPAARVVTMRGTLDIGFGGQMATEVFRMPLPAEYTPARALTPRSEAKMQASSADDFFEGVEEDVARFHVCGEAGEDFIVPVEFSYLY